MALGLYDKVVIMKNQSLSIDDYNVLALLYQPIIGPISYSIYLTLYALLNRTSFEKEITHNELVDILGISISKFESERKKLEAIGLINVYKKDNDLAYLLKNPLSARQFLLDGILGIYLQNTVGEELFNELANSFKINKFNRDEYKNITSSFDSVFENKELQNVLKKDDLFIDKSKKNNLNIDYSFDYETFMMGLPFNKLNQDCEDAIIKIAYAYGLNESEMQQVYYRSLVDGEFRLDKLQKEAKSLFKFKNQPTNDSDIMKSVRPEELFLHAANRKRMTTAEKNIINELVENYSYDVPTINVLLAYVLKKTDNEMPPISYFEKVINSWKKAHINTYEQAKKWVMEKYVPTSEKPKAEEEHDKWISKLVKNFEGGE